MSLDDRKAIADPQADAGIEKLVRGLQDYSSALQMLAQAMDSHGGRRAMTSLLQRLADYDLGNMIIQGNMFQITEPRGIKRLQAVLQEINSCATSAAKHLQGGIRPPTSLQEIVDRTHTASQARDFPPATYILIPNILLVTEASLKHLGGQLPGKDEPASQSVIVWRTLGGVVLFLLLGSLVFLSIRGPQGSHAEKGGLERLAILDNEEKLFPGEKVHRYHSVESLRFSPDSQALLAVYEADGGAGHVALLLAMPSLEVSATIKLDENAAPELLTFSPDGRFLFVPRKPLALEQPVSSEKFWEVREQTVSFGEIWDVSAGRPRTRLKVRENPFTSLATSDFSPDGKTIAAVTSNHRILLWDVPSGQLKTTLTGQAWVTAGTFLSDSEALALTIDVKGSAERNHRRKMLQVVEASNGKPIRILADCVGCSFEVSADRQTVAVTDLEENILVVDVPTAKAGLRIGPHASGFVVRKLSPDGKTYAITKSEGGANRDKIELWDVLSGQLRVSIPRDPKIAEFSPDSSTLALCSDECELWEVSSGRLLGTTQDPDAVTTGPKDLWSVSLSPDGRLLAMGRGHATLELWDLSSIQQGAGAISASTAARARRR